MRIFIVFAIIMVAVSGGLLLGGFVSEGFFSGMAAAPPGNGDAVSAGDGSSQTSPGFRIKMGSKSGGSGDSEAPEGDGEDEAPAAEDNITAASQVSTGGSSGGGGSGSTETPSTVCSSNADCKAGAYYTFCSGKTVMKAYGTYSCTNPGTSSASCSYSDNKAAATVEETCNYECDAGACVTGVYVDPSSKTVANGSEFTVDVVVSTNKKIFAGDFRIQYDTSALQVLSVDKGGFFGSGAWSNVTQKDNGLVHYLTMKMKPDVGSTGFGTIFTIKFRTIASGNAEIKISSGTEMVGDDDNEVDFESAGSVVNVR